MQKPERNSSFLIACCLVIWESPLLAPRRVFYRVWTGILHYPHFLETLAARRLIKNGTTIKTWTTTVVTSDRTKDWCTMLMRLFFAAAAAVLGFLPEVNRHYIFKSLYYARNLQQTINPCSIRGHGLHLSRVQVKATTSNTNGSSRL